jgi:hypothetical protein
VCVALRWAIGSKSVNCGLENPFALSLSKGEPFEARASLLLIRQES